MDVDLKKEVLDSRLSDIVLVLYHTDNYIKAYSSILDVLSTKKIVVIYITANKPHKVILNNLAINKIPSDNLYFIDCISKRIASIEEPVKCCVLADSPTALTEIIIILNQIVRKIQADRTIIVLDSVNTLLLYNEKKPVLQFLHFLINKVRMENLGGIFLSLKKDTEKDVLVQITPFFDKIVDMG